MENVFRSSGTKFRCGTSRFRCWGRLSGECRSHPRHGSASSSDHAPWHIPGRVSRCRKAGGPGCLHRARCCRSKPAPHATTRSGAPALSSRVEADRIGEDAEFAGANPSQAPAWPRPRRPGYPAARATRAHGCAPLAARVFPRFGNHSDRHRRAGPVVDSGPPCRARFLAHTGAGLAYRVCWSGGLCALPRRHDGNPKGNAHGNEHGASPGC
jgi:hypothetical protein